MEIITRSPEETKALGIRIGSIIKDACVLMLTGDLGAGKTCFVQGLAKGLGVSDSYYVTSPTFALINEYPGRLELVHMDLYRLVSEEDLEDLGFYDFFQSQCVIAIEWADKLPAGFLATQNLKGVIINIEIVDEDSRCIMITPSGLDDFNLI
jgi:tRNA threonylcarbamoyladenosine biosynthesis protein TsaE